MSPFACFLIFLKLNFRSLFAHRSVRTPWWHTTPKIEQTARSTYTTSAEHEKTEKDAHTKSECIKSAI